MNKIKLYKIIEKSYNAILKNKNFIFSSGLKDYSNFPLDRCDSSSELLKKYLYEEFKLRFNCIKVEYLNNNFHVFLESDEYIIDITASQFNDLEKFPEFSEVKNFNKIILCSKDEKDKYYFNTFIKKEYNLKHIEYELDFYNILLKTIK